MTHVTAPAPQRAVIIGAGTAGLACAVRLRAAGYAVTLLERHATVGGKIRTIASAAGPIDAGPTVLTMRHVFDDLFAQLGTRLEDHVTLVKQNELARHFWPDGSQLSLYADNEHTIGALRSFGGNDAVADFLKFTKRTRQLFAAFDAPMMQAPEPKLGTLAKHVLRQPHLIPAMAPLSTLKSLLKRSFRDPRLRQLFGRYATYVGGSPTHAPAILSLIWQAEANGVWVVKGGMHQLTQALLQVLDANGVDTVTNAHVDQIEVEYGRATAIRLLDGTRLPCNVLVHAGDPRALATGALGPGTAHIAPQTASAKRSFSARVLSFAATPHGQDLAHHNVFFADDAIGEFRDLMAGACHETPASTSAPSTAARIATHRSLNGSRSSQTRPQRVTTPMRPVQRATQPRTSAHGFIRSRTRWRSTG